MSTRKAKDDSVFHQARYASSPEFERGLIANLVAKRAAILDDPADRELIWFIQYLSHRPGGLPAVSRDLISTHGIQTASLEKLGQKRNSRINGWAIFRAALAETTGGDSTWQPLSRAEEVELGRAEAIENTENFLCEMCVNPAIKLDAGPSFFPKLINAMREHMAQFIKAKAAGAFVTALGKKVFEVLDYTAYCRGLTLMRGDARLGKTHAARAWCEQHPGRSRFVEVPSGNDDVSFFRNLARGLGLGNFLNYKVVQIRERVESALLIGHLVLVLDEAQRLWPQTNFREGYPKRIVWVMTMANAGVPIAMISTPQFFVTQKVVEKNGWNSAQFTGRISHYEPLPADLSPEDLMGVAKSVLPEANAQSLRALAVYARSSARYLAAIDSISKRARYIAMQAGRATATTEDVRKAMQESVIPADTKLHHALDANSKGRLPKMAPAPALPLTVVEPVPTTEAQEEILRANSRLVPIAPGQRTIAGNPASLIEA
jgi:hypothetical protein